MRDLRDLLSLLERAHGLEANKRSQLGQENSHARTSSQACIADTTLSLRSFSARQYSVRYLVYQERPSDSLMISSESLNRLSICSYQLLFVVLGDFRLMTTYRHIVLLHVLHTSRNDRATTSVRGCQLVSSPKMSLQEKDVKRSTT